MLSNGSETHRTSRPEVAGMVKKCLKFNIVNVNIETLLQFIGKVTIIRRVSNMEITAENYLDRKYAKYLDIVVNNNRKVR